MPTASLTPKGRVALRVPPRQRTLAKQIPGARYQPKPDEWHAPLSWATCKAMRGIFGEALEITDDLADWAWTEMRERVDPALRLRDLALDPDESSDSGLASPGLYPYQGTASDFLVTAGSAILADDMGTGKTVTLLDAVRRLDCFPLLIVCPNSMRGTWKREVEKWLGEDVRTLLLEGGAAARRKVLAEDWDVVVCGWSMLQRHSRLAPYGSISLSDAEKEPGEFNGGRFAGVIADEAHRAKEPKAKQTRALWAVGDAAVHRFAATGTPMEKHEAEFWSLLRFVAPKEWPSRSSFLDRYAVVTHNFWGGSEILGLNAATEPEFREIVNPRFLRRSKALVLPHLPPKVNVRRDVELSPKQRKAYKQMADGMIAEVEGGQIMTFDPLVQGARLNQFASATCVLEEDGEVRMSEPSGKIDALLEVLEELDDAPLAVFASSRQLLDLAAARLDKAKIKNSSVVGGMKQSARDDAVARYNEGDARVIMISLGAGAEGLSLKRGRTALFLDRSWSQIQNRQGEDRLHGTGRGDQDADKILIIDLVAKGTVEEGRAEILEAKGDRFEELVKDRDALLHVLTTHKRKGRK